MQSIENLIQLTPADDAPVDDSMARTTDYEYDPAGRLTAVVLPAVLDADAASPTFGQMVRRGACT